MAKSDDRRAAVRAWLKHYERSLYGKCAGLMEGLKQCRHSGIDMRGVNFRSLAHECEFWLCLDMEHSQRGTHRSVFSAEEWDAMHAWLREHDVDPQRDTLQSVFRRMCWSNVLTSISGIRALLKPEGIELELDKPKGQFEVAEKLKRKAA